MNLVNLKVGQDLYKMKSTIKSVFFYRICGTGMGAAATLIKEMGLRVAGNDIAFHPPMGDYLKKCEIECYQLDVANTFASSQGRNELIALLKQFDLIVVGNSLSGKSEEARLIEDCGTPFTSFPSLLGEFVLKDRVVIGVAGTHGKTTTTYFLTQLLQNLGEDPGYLIGGVLDDAPSSRLGASKYFVIESDEYDSCYFQKKAKFHFYEIDHLILTSLEFDHADIYEDIEAIIEEFSRLISCWDANKKNVLVVDFQQYPAIVQLQAKIPHLTFKTYRHFHTFFKYSGLVGDHNLSNLNGALTLLENEGYTFEQLEAATRDLKMVKRRGQERGRYKNALIIDDFAHHPRAIALTLAGIKQKYKNLKIIALFEPISATARSSVFFHDYLTCFNDALEVIWADSGQATTAIKFENLSIQSVVQEAQNLGKKYYHVDNLVDLMKQLDSILMQYQEEVVVVIMSNRTCLGLWNSDFVKKLI